MNRPNLAEQSADVVDIFRRPIADGVRGGRVRARPDDSADVVVPGRKPDPPSADPWRHDSPAGDPLHAGPRAVDRRAVPDVAAGPPLPVTVNGEHHTGLLRVRLAGDGGDVGEYALDVEQALHLAQRLRDAATAMQAFLAVTTPGPSRVSG